MTGKTLLLAFVLIGLVLAASPISAQQPPSRPPPPPVSNAPPPQACPPGTHWEEAGYVGHGKFREARCARDDGRE